MAPEVSEIIARIRIVILADCPLCGVVNEATVSGRNGDKQAHLSDSCEHAITASWGNGTPTIKFSKED